LQYLAGPQDDFPPLLCNIVGRPAAQFCGVRSKLKCPLFVANEMSAFAKKATSRVSEEGAREVSVLRINCLRLDGGEYHTKALTL
jgi:hypothetical protein